MNEAAQLMGYTRGRDVRQAVKCLRAAIEVGAVACETLNRQQHVFSKKDFPQEVWLQLIPTGPKSP
jgi:hypothetical protein